MSRASWVVLWVVGCGAPPPVVQLVQVYTPDAVASGPALFTRAKLSGSDVDVEVVGRKLGPILGYAFRLEIDGLTPSGDPVAEHVLGTDAVYLAKGGRWVFAGARKGAAAGGQTVDDETVLGRAKLHLDITTASLKLRDTSVRRANGDSVAAAIGGGKFELVPQ